MTTTKAQSDYQTWRKQRDQTLRVYYRSEDGTDQTTLLCPDHRDRFFLIHPDAYGYGEFGGSCEYCANA